MVNVNLTELVPIELFDNQSDTEGTFMMNSGICVDPANIRGRQINLQDISHHLSQIFRFGGTLPHGIYYSVAAHSLAIANEVLYIEKFDDNWKNLVKLALFHDMTEAYLGDIVSGLKASLPDYRKIENCLSIRIHEKYKVISYLDEDEIIKDLDSRIILNEAKVLMPKHYEVFTRRMPGVKPLSEDTSDLIRDLAYKPPEEIQQMFLGILNSLGVKDEI